MMLRGRRSTPPDEADLEDLKWLNIPKWLRPSFCALVLNVYGYTLDGAAEAIDELDLADLELSDSDESLTPAYFLERARDTTVVRGKAHGFDECAPPHLAAPTLRRCDTTARAVLAMCPSQAPLGPTAGTTPSAPRTRTAGCATTGRW